MVPGDSEESYLTVAEVAATLKLNQQTVRNWIDQGSLPALRVGRRVRIKRSDFERILEESYSGSPSSSATQGPSADDFWSGELVGLADPGSAATGDPGNAATVDPGTAARVAPGSAPTVDPARATTTEPAAAAPNTELATDR